MRYLFTLLLAGVLFTGCAGPVRGAGPACPYAHHHGHHRGASSCCMKSGDAKECPLAAKGECPCGQCACQDGKPCGMMKQGPMQGDSKACGGCGPANCPFRQAPAAEPDEKPKE